jgi:hypothetical protein
MFPSSLNEISYKSITNETKLAEIKREHTKIIALILFLLKETPSSSSFSWIFSNTSTKSPPSLYFPSLKAFHCALTCSSIVFSRKLSMPLAVFLILLLVNRSNQLKHRTWSPIRGFPICAINSFRRSWAFSDPSSESFCPSSVMYQI